MKSTYSIIGTAALVLFLAACGASEKKENGLEAKKARLEELKKEQGKLEAEIAKLDTSAAKAEKPKLVVLSTVQSVPFTHYIDLQGKIDAQNIAWVTPRNQGGLVRAVYVKQGDYVRKGQLLLKLDPGVVQQQIDQANVQLNLAKTVYERRKNLWDQKIGTEIDLINSKSNVENIEKQIALLKEQENMSNVYAELSGVADLVTIKVGETFSAAGIAQQMGIRIVNTGDLKVTANVPEAYQTKVKEGTALKVTLPEDNNKSISTKVSVAGKMIDPITRSFYIEGRVPGSSFRPGQVAMVRIQDYAVSKAITVPVNTLQNDEKGKFVMVAATENGKKVAKKRAITAGALYGDTLEVTSGLQSGDVVITEGFQGLYDGQAIITDAK
ncbi:efflux transporter periplasmic adaptor subunit [Niastella yeongjuensis]|uniref:Efflux transporter periplasmic adaptor subunit n=1 Tax=Niastella yeongjuensis TaxID=354355 RepID=A0A1V9ENK7_9BACT|nr:efflux RND transporter periplasmic adaptor subunit [Niastella yeongjuensis]OQP47534.1 efflux transporter periplasmic adaptor subunit [Niastella yeongjuensis]